MPLLRPREGDNDGGYAVADYGEVDRRVGTIADLEALAGDLHERGIAVCIGLVLNHTAAEHEWAAVGADEYVTSVPRGQLVGQQHFVR